MQAVQTPVIPSVAALVAAHPGTISLGQGVVHWGPPEPAIDAYAGFTSRPELHKYQYVQGIPPLVDALAAKLGRDNGIDLSDREIVVTAGGNMAFLNAVLAVADPGDEIVLVRPYYFNHEMAIRMADCVPVLVDSDDRYLPDPDRIEAAITPRTRAVVTISPNNPSGAVYPERLLREVNELCRRRGVFHFSDEAYEYFVYGEARHYSPLSDADSHAHTIGLYSLSKTYGFASWRIGWMVIPAGLAEAVRKIQDTNLICPPVVSQCAAVGALEAGPEWFAPHHARLARTREAVLDTLRRCGEHVTVMPAEGAFYLLIRVDCALSPMQAVEHLVGNHRVACIPASAFGLDDGCWLRISYGALEGETVVEGIGRLVGGLDALAGQAGT